MSNSWAVQGTGAQAFTAATPADLLRDMAEFVDEWTESDTSGVRFVADVRINFGGEGSEPWEGIVYTDNIEHVMDRFRELVGEAGSPKTDSPECPACVAEDEADYDEFESAFEESGSVINIGEVNVFLGVE